MKFKLNPLMLGAAFATLATLGGCGSDPEQPEIIDVFEEVGLWCKSPDIVDISSADFYPISAQEQADLDAAKAVAKAEAEADAGADWDAVAWEADFKYEQLDLYAILGLTIEETERQAIAKEEARAFQIEQGQDVIRGDDFDAWFEAWFANVPPASYLGPSQRLNRAVNASTPEMDGEEICYTPPLSCPNYKAIDESGNYDCIIPPQNPIDGVPPAEYVAGAGEAVAFYKNANHVSGEDNSALYENMVIHTWNNDDCTAYADDSISSGWGISGAELAGIDDNYGAYWIVNLVDEPSNCANIIFNDVKNGKKISDNDLTMPLGTASDITLHNVDKNSYADDGFAPNSLDGLSIINQHPYFGAEASSGVKSCGWGLEPDASGEKCLGEALTGDLACPAGTIAVGVGTEDIASKCVLEFDSVNTELFIKGGFNGWSATDDAKFTNNGGGKYQLLYTYTTEEECVVVAATDDVEGEDCIDNHDFKVADDAWSEPASFGSIKGGEQSGVGKTITMTVGAGVGQNMKVEMGKDKLYQYLVDASNVAAVTLTINEVPVAAFPKLMIGTQTVAFEYSDNGMYTATVNLEAEANTFTIADADNDFAIGAVGTDNIMTVDTEKMLEDGGGSLSFTSAQAEYYFNLDLSDVTMPKLEIVKGAPWGTNTVYVRGSINGWGVPGADKMIWDADAESYSVIYGIEAGGDHQFKFASEDWSSVNLGFDDVTFSGDADAVTVTNVGGNMGLNVSKSSTYLFNVSFDAMGKEVVKVSEAPIYLRGGVTASSWGADAGNQFTFMPTDAANTAEASHTYTIEVTYAGGENEFKVADANWGGSFGYNYGAADGASADIVLGEAFPLAKSNNNMKLDIPAGTYIFTLFDGENKTMTVTAK
jgi:hypothetical protein